LIQAGNVIEKIEYENPVVMYEKLMSKRKSAIMNVCVSCGRNKCASDDDKIKNREIVLYRARNEVRRLINANVYRYIDEMCNIIAPVFLTLTFAENITSITLANKEFRKFIKRLGYYVARDQSHLKYVAVPEFQKRGAVHYHLVMFNLPFIKTKVIADIWNHGFIKINTINNVSNIGAYVSKYRTKAEDTKDKLAGQKCYLSSHDLCQPYEIKLLTGSPEARILLEEIKTAYTPGSIYYNENDSEHYGIIKYTQYECDNFSLEEVIQDGQKCTSVC